MSAPGTEDVLQHTPSWIENNIETSSEWKTILGFSDNIPPWLDNEHIDLNEQFTTLPAPSDALLGRLLREHPYLSSFIEQISCLECSRKFSLRKSLRRHKQTVHTGARNFPCLECDKAFSRRDQLDRHRKERHRRIEPVECMQCGRLVKDRSLRDHLRSGRCRRRRDDPEHEAQTASTASDRREIMLAEIFQKVEEDSLLFESFSTSSICDPLSVSSYLSYKATQGLNKQQSCGTLQVGKQEPEPELVHLRGLTMRYIVRGLATGRLDDELDGAIRAFAFTEHIFFPDAAKTHDAFIQYLDTDRPHRLPQVLSAVKGALDQWTPVSIIMDNMLSSKSSAESRAVVRSSNAQIQHQREPRKPMFDRLSILHIPLKLPNPSLSSVTHFTAKDNTKDRQKQLPPLTKRKRKSNEPTSSRPKSRKTCPHRGCGKSVLQRVFNRHVREVHGQEKVYECDVKGCEEVFSRKDSLKRHEDEQHGEGSNRIECGNCGESVCRRAMEDHVRRPKCQKKGSLEIQAIANDAD